MVTGTVTSGSTVGAVIIREGDRIVSMSSTDPWYRYFRALADLFIAGEIDTHMLQDAIPTERPMPSEYACPAARHVLGSIYLAIDEPSCIHRGNTAEDIACTCEPMDRRERLRELIGA